MTNIPGSRWEDVWTQDNTPKWDYLSQIILSILQAEIGGVEGKLMLEAGSGSGRISLKLANASADTYLLDNSFSAINFSKQIFKTVSKNPRLVCASIDRIPYHDNIFDVTWNAGVIEHFIGEGQDDVLKEMARTCKKGGLIITINPNANSILHTFGKFIIEKMARYPFGREVPIKTLKDKSLIMKSILKKEEYSIGFIVLWVGMFKRLTLLPAGSLFKPILNGLNNIFCFLDESFLGCALRKLDFFISKLFGGYLLVSVFKKV